MNLSAAGHTVVFHTNFVHWSSIYFLFAYVFSIGLLV